MSPPAARLGVTVTPGRLDAWDGAPERSFQHARRRCHGSPDRRQRHGTVGPMATYLAIDVGTDRLAAGVVDEAGEVIVRDRVATPPRDVWPALHRLVRRVVAARPDDADPLEACGVSCEGPDRPRHAARSRRCTCRCGRASSCASGSRDLTGLPTVLGPAGHARVLAERWTGRRPGRRRRHGAADVRRRRGRGRSATGGCCRAGSATPARSATSSSSPTACRASCGGPGCLTSYVSAVGDRGGDEPAAAAGAGVGRSSGRG